MRILVVDSAGRGRALAETVSQSPCVTGVSVITWTNNDDTLMQAKAVGAEFVITGPEAALAAGLVDDLTAAGIAVFGPTKAAAFLETNKIAARDLCDKLGGIPQPAYTFTSSFELARREIELTGHTVVKARGLTGGKGVEVAETVDEAVEAARLMLVERKFGEAGSQILIEERLRGDEVSVFFASDGQEVAYLGCACDHKRRFENNKGPNTGGMGAYAPAPNFTPKLRQQLYKIASRVVRKMWIDGVPFRGVLFMGVMLVQEKDETVPKLLELNARFGDPETQVILPLINEDIVPYLLATLECRGLTQLPPLTFKDAAAVCVCTADKGYPEVGSRKESFVGVGTTLAVARNNAYEKLKREMLLGNLKARVWRTDIAANVPSLLEAVG